MLTPLTDADSAATLAATSAGIVLFYKKLCPHCKNMEKVLQKFAALEPDVALFQIDIEENPETAGRLQAERPPTLVIIRSGNAADRKAGLMNHKELAAWFEGV